MRSKHWDNSNWRGPLPTELSVSLKFAHWRPSERRVHRPGLAGSITASFIVLVTRHGGRGSTSIRFQSRCGSGSTRRPMGSSLGARKARRRCTPRSPRHVSSRSSRHEPRCTRRSRERCSKKCQRARGRMSSLRGMSFDAKLPFRKPKSLIRWSAITKASAA
jgi:hypothetical protein